MPRSARRLIITAVVALASAAELAGCGRVGTPRAPEMVIPRMPDPLTAASAPDGVKLTWRRPREYVDGEPLDDLAGFRVLRACQPDATFVEITAVPVTDQTTFRKVGSYTMLDHQAPLGVPCRYQVIAFTFDGYTSPPAESEDVIRTVPGAQP